MTESILELIIDVERMIARGDRDHDTLVDLEDIRDRLIAIARDRS